MRQPTFLVVVAGLLLLLGSACSRNHGTATPIITPPPPPPPTPTPVVNLGDPRTDLTAEERAAFDRGRIQFDRRWRPSEGLGPFYNATSCASCHSQPVTGGTADLYRNFYLAVWGFTPDMSLNLFSLPSPVMPAFGSLASATFQLEGGRPVLPATFQGMPVRVAQRNSIPIFGVGLFESISNDTILANADPDDLDGDGISGRVNNDGAGMGRFGMKSQSNNIEFFTRAPLMNQMGITSNPFRGAGGTVSWGHAGAVQASSTPNAPTRDNDGVPDPEISPQELGDLIAFTRFLAPPQPTPFSEAAKRGEQHFLGIGCAKCHIPSLPSSRGPVQAYTDLLIHDMGDALVDRIGFGTPQTSRLAANHTQREFRTAPLWGIRHASPYLHDGRAATLDEAIRLHEGEAAAITAAYRALEQAQRDDLLEFLRHL